MSTKLAERTAMVRCSKLMLPLVVLVIVLTVGAFLRLPGIRQLLADTFSWRESSTAMMSDNFLGTKLEYSLSRSQLDGAWSKLSGPRTSDR